MESNSKRQLVVKSNETTRTFTLRFKYEDGSKVNYRTLPMSKEEFNSCRNNTLNDWFQFLKSDEYYEVKK